MSEYGIARNMTDAALRFDRVLGTEATQAEVFEDVARPGVINALQVSDGVVYAVLLPIGTKLDMEPLYPASLNMPTVRVIVLVRSKFTLNSTRVHV